MSSETVTRASVLARVEQDPRLADQNERCEIYRSLARLSRGFSQEDYPGAGNRGCSEHPIDQFAWRD